MPPSLISRRLASVLIRQNSDAPSNASGANSHFQFFDRFPSDCHVVFAIFCLLHLLWLRFSVTFLIISIFAWAGFFSQFVVLNLLLALFVSNGRLCASQSCSGRCCFCFYSFESFESNWRPCFFAIGRFVIGPLIHHQRGFGQIFHWPVLRLLKYRGQLLQVPCPRTIAVLQLAFVLVLAQRW